MPQPEKSTNREQQPTAAESYAQHRSDIARLLDVLEMELDKHGEKAKSQSSNWGLAGDLGKVRSDLVTIVAFMSGMDEEQVRAFLDERE